MPDIWKTEFHVTEAGETSPSAWYEEGQEDDAIAHASRTRGKVQKVEYFNNHYTTLYDFEDEGEEV